MNHGDEKRDAKALSKTEVGLGDNIIFSYNNQQTFYHNNHDYHKKKHSVIL